MGLLRNSSEYSSFVEYYEGREVGFLGRMGEEQVRRKQAGLEADPLEEMGKVCALEGLNLSKYQQELIVAHMQHYYQRATHKRTSQIRQNYQARIRREEQS